MVINYSKDIAYIKYSYMKKDLELQYQWQQLLNNVNKLVGKRPKDLNGILFLIGVQELGQGIRSFTKEEKQDVMHIAICKLLSYQEYYTLEGMDKEGWPIWRLNKQIPKLDVVEQERMLKLLALEYFEKELDFNDHSE